MGTENTCKFMIQGLIKSFSSILKANEYIQKTYNNILIVTHTLLVDKTPSQEKYSIVYEYKTKKNRSPKSEYEMEANGLILDSFGNVVSIGFPITYNYEDVKEEINWNDCWMEPEYIGIYVIMFYHEGKIFFRTVDCVDLSQARTTIGMKIFNKCMKNIDTDKFSKMENSARACLLFKYTTKSIYTMLKSTNTCIYSPSNELVLLSGFNKTLCKNFIFKYVQGFARENLLMISDHFVIRDFSEVFNIVGCVKMDQKHKFILRNGSNIAVQVNGNKKTVEEKARLSKDNITPTHLFNIAKSEEVKDIMLRHPEWRECIEILIDLQNKMIRKIDTEWVNISGVSENRYQFAKNVMRTSIAPILFEIWDGRIKGVVNVLRSIKPKVFFDLLSQEDKKEFEEKFNTLKEKMREI